MSAEYFAFFLPNCEKWCLLLIIVDTVQLPGRFYKPCVLQGFLILFTEEKLKTRMDFACVPREPRTSPARFLLRVAGISTRRSRVITHDTGISCSCTSKNYLIQPNIKISLVTGEEYALYMYDSHSIRQPVTCLNE